MNKITNSFKVLYVTATDSEAETLKLLRDIRLDSDRYSLRNFKIDLLVTGVGSLSTAWSLKQWISINEKPDLAINGGIAGSYKNDFCIGDVVMPVTDCFADAGIEDGDNFLTLFEAGLMKSDEFPFRNGKILADNQYIVKIKDSLKTVNAITVNTATGSEATRARLVRKFNPDIETMEGATFFYICYKENIPFLALRGISNIVEPRDRSKWNVALALKNLSEELYKVFLKLDK